MLEKTFARPTLMALLLLPTLLLAQDSAVLTIHADQPVAKVSPALYGLMTEEINYSYDGGLYAEMVRNRTFGNDWSGVQHWILIEDGNSSAEIGVDKQTGPSESLQSSLRINVQRADIHNPAGVLNDGWWGMPLRPNTTYQGSFYAKASSGDLGPVSVRLVSNQSGKTLASTEVNGLTTAWEQIHFTLDRKSVV